MTRRTILLILIGFMGLLAACVELSTLNHASRRIAFMGDSLTQGWALPRENFGIYGQTTAQMRARFQHQIPGYATVIILGGTNDILLHIDSVVTLANLNTMVDLAQADGVEPILAELPPVYRANGSFQPAVDRLNQGLVQLAHRRHVQLVDYDAALAGHPDAYSDGVHLKRRGYLRMEWALLKVKNIF